MADGKNQHPNGGLRQETPNPPYIGINFFHFLFRANAPYFQNSPKMWIIGAPLPSPTQWGRGILTPFKY